MMRQFLVTVKLPKNPVHDPQHKILGPCPVTGVACTDVTGQHHTFLLETERDLEYIKDVMEFRHHVTRIEAV